MALLALGALSGSMLLGALLPAVLGVHGSSVTVDKGLFELDGNQTKDSAGGNLTLPVDWVNLFTGGGSAGVPSGGIPGILPPNAIASAFVHDGFSSAGASSGKHDGAINDSTTFATGSKDTLNIPTGWECNTDNNVVDKDDILHAYAIAFIRPGDGHLIIYLGMERFTTEGDNNIGFWILQNKTVGCIAPPDNSAFTGNHTAGDTLIISEFTGGGVITTLEAHTWTASPFALNTTAVTGVDCRNATAGDVLCGRVNNVTFVPPWFTSDKDNDNITDIGEFFEVGIDVSAVANVTSPCFASFLGETRSSPSLTADLKDYALGSLSTCGSIEGQKFFDQNDNGAKDGGEPGLAGWDIKLFNSSGIKIANVTTNATGFYRFDDVPSGNYTICENLFNSSWVQTFPNGTQTGSTGACSTLVGGGGGAFGWNVTITAGASVSGSGFSSSILPTSVTGRDFGNFIPRPNITLTKVPNLAKVENGTLVTYTYNATNTGNVPLLGVNITDLTFGVVVAGPTTLAPNASLVATLNRTLTTTTINTARVDAVSAFGQQVNATAMATVTVIHPAIDLTKTPSSDKVENGTTVTYRFVARNIGDTTLFNVTIVDSILGPLTLNATTLLVGQWAVNTTSTVLTVDTSNNATATGTDQLGTNVTAEARAFVRVLHPAIDLTKTPDSEKVESGANVTYTFIARNTGDTTLFNVTITDSIFGPLSLNATTLLVGQWAVNTTSTVLTVDTANNATATGVDQLSTRVQAEARAFVRVLHPAIDLTKTPSDEKVETGSTVTYRFVARNIGDTTLFNVTVTDSILGPLDLNATTLLVGQWAVNTTSTVLTVDTSNNATATGVDQLSTRVQAEARAFVRVLHPAIDLSKTPRAEKAENGTTVTYDFVARNTGDTTLFNVTITDSIFGPLDLNATTLAVGQWAVNSTTTFLTVDTANNATATGTDQEGAQVQAEARAFVRVIHPDIALTKTPSSEKVENGATVTYTFVARNTGDTTLFNVTITDSIFGPLTLNATTLLVGQWAVNTTSTVLTTDTANNATATGVDQTGAPVTAEARAFVRVLHPAIDLTKTPDSEKVESGANVTYTFIARNTGDTTLFNVTITDSILGPLSLNATTLLVGQWAVNTTSTVLTVDTANNATATGEDQLGTDVQAEARAFVRVLHPAIDLTKTPDQDKVLNGTTVTYTFVARNTGDTTLFNITITDSIFGPLTLNATTLLVGQWAVNTTSTVLTTDTSNNATATGEDQLSTRVQAEARAFVDVIHPSIDVTKSCSPATQGAPGTITWNITVRNSGDVTLENITVDDTPLADYAIGTLTAGTSNTTLLVQNGGLAAGNYTNTANVIGDHQLGQVRDSDSATCQVTGQDVKQFTGAFSINGSIPAPTIIDGGFNATISQTKTGPQVYLEVTYFVANTAAFLGSQFDNTTHVFTLWDKWAGNVMALNSAPVAFNATSNTLTLANGAIFSIDPRLTGAGSYKFYINSGGHTISINGCSRPGRSLDANATVGHAEIALHLGSQQDCTNPGGDTGGTATSNGNSYDAAIIWLIGPLSPGQSATLKIFIAPGKNPGGVLAFSSCGFTLLNTGPVVRAWNIGIGGSVSGDTATNLNLAFTRSRTVRLGVIVNCA